MSRTRPGGAAPPADWPARSINRGTIATNRNSGLREPVSPLEWRHSLELAVDQFQIQTFASKRTGYSLHARDGVCFNLVLPDSEHFPAEATQLLGVPLISFAVSANLVSPEGWQLVLPDWKSPPMPEIAVDEEGHPCLREYEIRTPREGAIMLSEFEPGGLQ